MIEFSYEVLTAILIIVFLVLLCAEYLWLYILSKKNEEENMQKKNINSTVHALMESFLYSPTDTARQTEIQSLMDYIGNDPVKKDEAIVQLIQLLHRAEDLPDQKRNSLEILQQQLDPIPFYAEQLEKGNDYKKSYAARRLADFHATDQLEKIRQLLKSRRADVVYNAAMALSELGDLDSVLFFAKKCENNRNYSHRILLELFQRYQGSRAELVKRVYEECNNYIKATAIKAYTADRIEELSGLYLEGLTDNDVNLKVACVRALAQFGNPDYEQKMNIALHDKNWIVRLAAVTGLEKIGTKSALSSLVTATQDEEWWVRSAAARAIVNMDFQLLYVEQVLSGYDKYAADAVKNALYKQINLNGGELR